MIETFKKIESPDFDFHGNQAAGTNMLRGIIASHDYFKELKEAIDGNTESKDVVTNHVFDLLVEPFDKRYANPRDIAVATCLLALSESGIFMWLPLMISLRRDLFWSRQISNQLLKSANSTTTD